MFGCLGVVQMLSCCVDGEQAQESHQGCGLAVTHLNQAVIVLGAW